jgi:hypothetical protein
MAFLAFTFLCGCAHPIGRYKLLVKDDAPELDSHLSSTGNLNRVAAHDCTSFVYVLFFAFWQNIGTRSIDTAVNREIVRNDPNMQALADMDLRSTNTTTLFYNDYCYEVQGRPVSIK